jgi:hypothetical protein
MKGIFIILILVSTQALAAFDVCSFNETSDLWEALKAEGIRPHKTSKNHTKFTFSEKQMIHLVVTLQDWLKGASKEEAMETFADMNNGKKGPNAGEIKYFRIEDREYALVHYWPGDNEFGAIFQIKRNNAYRFVAEVEDSFITCK